jgi:hypothetical protein
MPANAIDTRTFGDTSPTISSTSLKNQSSGQFYNMVGTSADAKSRPSQDIINNLDKGGHRRYSN